MELTQRFASWRWSFLALALVTTLVLQRGSLGANRFFINDQTAKVEETGVSIPVLLDNEEPRHGFSLSIKYERRKLALTGVEVTGTAAERADWSGGTIWRGELVWAVIMGFNESASSFDPQKVLPAGEGLVVARLVGDVLAKEPTTTTVTLENGLRPRRIEQPGINLLTTEGRRTEAELGPPAVITVQPEVIFIRGDFNGDGEPDISDAVAILGYLFLGDPGPNCLDRGDTDDSGELDISDAIRLLGFLFLGEEQPPPPFPDPGPDPTDDLLECKP